MPSPIDAHRRSPLFHRRPLDGDEGQISLAERPFLGKFILRTDPVAAADLLTSAIGVDLPTEPLTSASSNEGSLLWMGPDEWMLVTAPNGADTIAARLRSGLAGVHHQLVEVGDYYTVIEVSGERARDALSKLTTLDVHQRAFRTGMVAGSMFGHANALLWQTEDDSSEHGPVFRLIIRWSMADYLWCLLANAGGEWGLPREVPVKNERLTVD
jgi:sarcosine oxidase subunit gamma